MANNIRLRDSNGIVRNLDISGGGTGADNGPDALTNLGLSGAFTVDYKESASMSVPATGTQWGSIDVTKTGYTVLGVVGHYTIGTGDYMTIYACYQDFENGNPNSIRFALGNRFSSALTTRLRVYVLYVRN